jgi:hypothetical protein
MEEAEYPASGSVRSVPAPQEVNDDALDQSCARQHNIPDYFEDYPEGFEKTSWGQLLLRVAEDEDAVANNYEEFYRGETILTPTLCTDC